MLEKEQIINKIVSGIQYVVVRNSIYEVRQPDIRVKLEADNYYNTIINEHKFDNFITQQELVAYLVSNGLISFNFDNNIKIIEKEIEDLKIKLYHSLLKIEENKKIRKQLNLVKNKRQEMLLTRHMFDSYTLEGYASSMSKQYILIHSIYKDGTKLWNSLNDVDISLLDNIAQKLIEAFTSVETIREIARTEPWRNLWSISKLDLFPANSSFFFTDEQRMLIGFSKMYDSVFEHGECPPDKIIEDDDMLDGWMAHQHRRNDKAKMDAYLENIGLKTSDTSRGGSGSKNKGLISERFVFTKTKEEAEAIYDINSEEAIRDMQQRAALLKNKSVVRDTEFQDVRNELLARRKK